MSIASRLGLRNSGSSQDVDSLYQSLDAVVEMFERNQFSRRDFKSLEKLIEDVIELKKHKLTCMSKNSGINPDNDMTVYAFSLEHVSEKLAEDILSRCEMCVGNDPVGNLNFGETKNSSFMEKHLDRVREIPRFSGKRLDQLKQECAESECYESLNMSWNLYKKLKKINDDVMEYHRKKDKSSVQDQKPNWTHAD